MTTTAKSLQARWDERDARYARRRRSQLFLPLIDDEVRSIRAFRTAEVATIPSWEQPAATRALYEWRPPVETR